MRKSSPLNNNRNNNRRRGRGNNNRNQGGGGNQLNRIDSRARGNAPQLLDKYKKLAQDAQHHGDRVQAEYYLQFADHYQRVIADNKALQDEARAKRNEGRGDDRGDDRGENRNDARNEDNRDGQDGRDDSRNRRPRNRNDRNDNRSDNRRDEGRDERVAGSQQGEIGSEGDAVDMSGDAPEGDKPAKPRRARTERAPRARKEPAKTEGGAEPKPRAKVVRAPRKKPAKSDDGIDVGVLPPAISTDGDADSAEAAE